VLSIVFIEGISSMFGNRRLRDLLVLAGCLGCGFLLLGLWAPEALALSKVNQSGVPQELSASEGAILEENDAYFTVMTARTVRTIAKSHGQITNRDIEGDKAFVAENRESNADYWYWAHQKAREALVMALGRQPLEAVKVIESVPFSDHLIPEYRWILSGEFKQFLQGVSEDLGYLYDPTLGVEVFLTNYQVSKLQRQYVTEVPKKGDLAGMEVRPDIPMLSISLRDLVATPRKGEEGKVGLDVLLKLPEGGIHDSLLPGSPEYKKRKLPIQPKLLTVSDSQQKLIPVSSADAKNLLTLAMWDDPKFDRFLMIQGSMKSSREATTLSEDLKIVVNPNSSLTKFLSLQRKVFTAARTKKG
jgi:hypothetical protein